MLASLFFHMDGRSQVSSSPSLAFSEGLRLEIPCVESAIFFSQDKSFDSEGESLASSSSFYTPENWGLLISSSKAGNKKSPLDCAFAVGSLTLGGPLPKLKNPLPSINKKWKVSTTNALKLKAGLPSISAEKKTLSFFLSLESPLFSASFAAISLDEKKNYPPPDFSMGNLLFQLSFSPQEEKDFLFADAITFSSSEIGESKSSRYFSLDTFHTSACIQSLLNETLLIKKWDAVSLSIQNSLSVSASDIKSGLFLCDNILFCLTRDKISASIGAFLSDYGFISWTGSEIFELLRLYGAFSSSFSFYGASVNMYSSCMTGLGYEDTFPVEEELSFESLSTDLMGGFKLSYEGMSFIADCTVKKLCSGNSFRDSSCDFSLELGRKEGSLRGELSMPLIFFEADLEWGMTMSFKGDEASLLSGSVDIKFKNLDYIQSKASLTFAFNELKASVSISVPESKKISWSLSLSMTL